MRVELILFGYLAAAVVAQVVGRRRVRTVYGKVRVDADFGGQFLFARTLLRLAADLFAGLLKIVLLFQNEQPKLKIKHFMMAAYISHGIECCDPICWDSA